jgi:5'-nucleotidase
MTKPNGQRVKKMEVLCKKCRVPKFVPLNDSEIYKLAIPTYTATGGDGYKVIQDNIIAHHLSG